MSIHTLTLVNIGLALGVLDPYQRMGINIMYYSCVLPRVLPGVTSLGRKQLSSGSGGGAGVRGSKRGKLVGAVTGGRAPRGRGAAVRGGAGAAGYRSYFNYQQQAVQVHVAQH